VAAIVEGGITTPDAYVRSKSIPTFTNGAAPEDYAAANATVFPLVGTIEAWAAEAAYFIVKIANKPIKSVGVLTTGTDPEFDSYIKGYWNKLGVTKVDLEPGFPPGGSCSSDVLKWKSLNVDYIDVVATTAGPSCLQAEGQLGWKPAPAKRRSLSRSERRSTGSRPGHQPSATWERPSPRPRRPH
jgi:hypothetical protein